MKPASRAAMMLIHASHSRGRSVLVDADLTQMAGEYPELRPVFEEAQFLRDENTRMEDEKALAAQN